METDYQKADSHNLPSVDVVMVSEYMKQSLFNQPESSGLKAKRKGDGDAAIGYVQVKRNGGKCVVKGKVCPEHKNRNKPYSVTAVIDEEKEEIDSVQCLDCAASLGGCKHCLAFIMWLHRRSEEPAPTAVVCYWRKPVLAKAGANLEVLKAANIGRKRQVATLQSSSRTTAEGFLLEVSALVKDVGQICPIYVHFQDEVKDKKLSLHRLMSAYIKEDVNHTADDFISYCCKNTTVDDIREVRERTVTQGENTLWHEMRYGRITASKIFEVSRCKTATGSLVNQVLGVAKIFPTGAMRRGTLLEKDVRIQLEKKLKTKIYQTGLCILPNYIFIGASPDGTTEESVVEIKCPSTKKALEKYILKNKEIAPKHYAQIQLQMLATGLKKGFFCVAHPDFETTKDMTVVEVAFDENLITTTVNASVFFWKQNIFPILLNSLK